MLQNLAERGDEQASVSRGDNAPARRVGVVVLGMHRSGTSAITRMLGLLGCALPSTLMAAASHNPRGHWESQRVADLNDEVLAVAGTRWNDWLPVNERLSETLVWPQLVAKGRAVLREQFADAPLFVLKDPRICQLAGFWIEVLAAEQVDPVFVLPVRNPLEVAQSLATRDGIDEAHGLLIWLRHVLAAEAATRGRVRIFTDYAGLLTNREAMAHRLSKGLGVVWPRVSALSFAEISEFLTPDLRHHVSDMVELGENPAISPWLRQAYEVLLNWARQGEKSSDYPVLDDISRAFDDAAPAFARPMLKGELAAERAAQIEAENTALASERDQVAQRLGELEAELARMIGSHSNLAEKRETTARRLGEVEAEFAQACAERDARAAERDEQVKELAEERHRSYALGLELETLQNRLADQDSALRQKQEEAAQAWAEVAAEREAVAALNERTDGLEQQAEALTRSAQDSEAWVFRLGGERRQAELREHRLTSEVQRLTREMSSLQREAAGLKEALAAEKSLPKGENDEAKKEAQRLRDALTAQEAANTARIGQMEHDLGEAQTARRTAEDRALQADALKVDLEHKLAAQSVESAKLAKLLGNSDGEGATLKAELAHTKAQLDNHVGEITQLDRLHREKEHQLDKHRQQEEWLHQLHAMTLTAPRWWAFIPPEWRRQRELRQLKHKKLFDGSVYLDRNPDVAASGMDPLRHYILHGLAEGRKWR